MMQIQFLGTAAAEGFPGLFCRCEHCRKARALGGRNIRTRSSVMIDGVLKIDFPPDTLHHVLMHGLDLAAVQDLLITHTHLDHLNADDLAMRLPVYAHGCERPLHIYAHDHAIRLCCDAIGHDPEGKFSLHLVQPFVTYETQTARVTPLLADHDPRETCLLFHVEKDGATLLYGHDTGWFPDPTWQWLQGRRIDAAILDCTCGNMAVRRNHMGIAALLEVRDELKRIGALGERSVVVATHFSHNIGLQHADLTGILEPHGVVVAYDGMVLEVSGGSDDR